MNRYQPLPVPVVEPLRPESASLTVEEPGHRCAFRPEAWCLASSQSVREVSHRRHGDRLPLDQDERTASRARRQHKEPGPPAKTGIHARGSPMRLTGVDIAWLGNPVAEHRLLLQHGFAERARHAAEVAIHDERRRLALALHDSFGATLFRLGAGIRQLGAEPGLDHEMRSRLSCLEQQALEAAADLRRSLRSLNTAPAQVALGVAVREHCRAFEERTGVSTRMIALSELPAMSASRAAALADAARESLLNAEKHAHAKSVVVAIFATHDRVALTISDDGVGLPDRAAFEGGIGLAAVSERLARVGGAVTMSINDDGGVSVHAWIPL
jgi:signal transduction histidine kinase